MKEATLTLLGPNEEQFVAIQRELGEDPERIKFSVKLLNEWLRAQPHLPKKIDNNLFEVFLRGCKHDLERTKKKLDAYFTARATFKDVFSDRDPCNEEIRTAAHTFQIVVLPNLTPNGHRITIHRITEADPSLFVIKDIFKLAFMLGDLRMSEETPIAGDIFVFDLGNMSVAHCGRAMQPILLSKMLAVAQQAYPQRLSQIHIVNLSPPINRIIVLFKSFMKEKLKNRFVVHTDNESFSKALPRACLPEDYGGVLPSLTQLQGAWQKKMLANKKWFEDQEQVCADIQKRPLKSHVPTFAKETDVFGSQGAFRKLAID